MPSSELVVVLEFTRSDSQRHGDARILRGKVYELIAGRGKGERDAYAGDHDRSIVAHVTGRTDADRALREGLSAALQLLRVHGLERRLLTGVGVLDLDEITNPDVAERELPFVIERLNPFELGVTPRALSQAALTLGWRFNGNPLEPANSRDTPDTPNLHALVVPQP